MTGTRYYLYNHLSLVPGFPKYNHEIFTTSKKFKNLKGGFFYQGETTLMIGRKVLVFKESSQIKSAIRTYNFNYWLFRDRFGENLAHHDKLLDGVDGVFRNHTNVYLLADLYVWRLDLASWKIEFVSKDFMEWKFGCQPKDIQNDETFNKNEASLEVNTKSRQKKKKRRLKNKRRKSNFKSSSYRVVSLVTLLNIKLLL